MKNYPHVVSFVIAINVACYSIGSSNWVFGESGKMLRDGGRERGREWKRRGRLEQLEL